MDFNAASLVRENIKKMKAYSSARHEFSGDAAVFLDANENAMGSPVSLPTDIQNAHAVGLNRYPDPMQKKLKEKLSGIKGLPPKHIFLGNGSDEAIDLLFRIFCEPGRDNVLIFPPTYGMYEVCAEMNDIKVKKIPLTTEFQLDLEAIADAVDPFTKLLFICSPNNPTGNSIRREDIEIILNNFEGLVVIDEAYINYAKQRTFIPELTEYPNLVILQTLSKAWGMAGLRLGMAFAGETVISYMDKVKYPYNINTASQELALTALEKTETINEWIRIMVDQRARLVSNLLSLPFVLQIFPSDANFILVKVNDPENLYYYLASRGIIVRDRSRVILCENCLRITVGNPSENKLLVETLKAFSS